MHALANGSDVLAGAAERPFEIDWWPNRIVFAVDAVDRLGQSLAQLGRRRALVVCGRSIAASAALARVKAALGTGCAGVFAEIEMHSPLPALQRGAQAAADAGADCIVSIGGGSAIDSGKGIALIDTVGDAYRSYSLSDGQGGKIPALRLAHIAIPTTTGSGSEIAPTCGLRDPTLGRKVIFRDTGLIPGMAILDPTMAVETPAVLTAASGVTALARCIEAMYSGRRNPFHTAIALHALRMLARALPRSVAAPDDLTARGDCLVAAAMSAISANANVSAVHAIGHAVGGKYALQHGLAHAILLAPTMRLMLPSIGGTQLPLLEALGQSAAGLDPDAAGQKAADIVAELVAGLPLPGRLRDHKVPEADITALADHAAHDAIMRASAAPVPAEQIAALLRSVW